MKREYIVSVELEGLEQALDSIRWKHIDIDKIIEEELQEQVKGIIRAYGEAE